MCVLVITHADPLEHFLLPELTQCVNRLTSLANATDLMAALAVLNIKQRGNAEQQTGIEKTIDYADTEVPGTISHIHISKHICKTTFIIII